MKTVKIVKKVRIIRLTKIHRIRKKSMVKYPDKKMVSPDKYRDSDNSNSHAERVEFNFTQPKIRVIKKLRVNCKRYGKIRRNSTWKTSDNFRK